ncbi:hypothetical protein RRG08_024467 [Elysia crispata]|uniref:Uncharacterized protein n=1 Tax=Elysia crispata TaxID=231223 RepID=A0AAE0YQW5_9GAST|nr:hypothetical protein RRG08_024467 [Elysia crispata]
MTKDECIPRHFGYSIAEGRALPSHEASKSSMTQSAPHTNLGSRRLATTLIRGHNWPRYQSYSWSPLAWLRSCTSTASRRPELGHDLIGSEKSQKWTYLETHPETISWKDWPDPAQGDLMERLARPSSGRPHGKIGLNQQRKISWKDWRDPPREDLMKRLARPSTGRSRKKISLTQPRKISWKDWPDPAQEDLMERLARPSLGRSRGKIDPTQSETISWKDWPYPAQEDLVERFTRPTPRQSHVLLFPPRSLEVADKPQNVYFLLRDVHLWLQACLTTSDRQYLHPSIEAKLT